MQLKPDEIPNMVEDEIRRVTLKLAGAVGTNTITDSDVTCDTLTISSVSASGTDLNFLVTASRQGTHQILASADLSSGETVKGYVRAKVNGKPCDTGSVNDYGR